MMFHSVTEVPYCTSGVQCASDSMTQPAASRMVIGNVNTPIFVWWGGGGQWCRILLIQCKTRYSEVSTGGIPYLSVPEVL